MKVMLLVSVLLLFPGDAYSAPPARLSAKVVNAQDEPLANVEVTITHRQKSDYLKKMVTGKRGRFHLLVQAPTLFDDCFLFRFEAESYQPLEAVERLTPGQSLRATYTLRQESGVEYHNQGVLALRSRDYSSAESSFLKALEIQPNLSQSHYALAELYLQQERYREAAASAEAALTDQHKDSRTIEILHIAQKKLGNAERAQQALRALADTGNATAAAIHLYNEGIDAHKRGDLALARQNLLESVAHNPDLVSAYIGLAELETQANRPADAIEATKRALAIEPDNTQARRIAFQGYCLSNLWGKANMLLKKLIAGDHELSDLMLYQWGIGLMPPEETAVARITFEHLLDLNPDYAKTRYILGWLAAKTGDVPAARAHLRQFLELAPMDPGAEAARELMAGL